MVSSIGIAVSGLQSAQTQLQTNANNIANVNTTGSLEQGGQEPFTPQETVSEAVPGGGVRTTIVPRDPAFVPSFAPDSPFADENGIIGAPNVSLNEELIGSLQAEQAFEASATVISGLNDLNDTLLDIFDDDA